MLEHDSTLIDTDVFSALNVTPREMALRQGHPVDEWIAALTGRRVFISFQTRAEVLAGAYLAGWGERRLAPILERLDAMPTIYVNPSVIEAVARLLAEAQKSGHPLGNKVHHVADRWVAACAISKHLPLLTGNRKHFEGAPGLTLHEVPNG